MQDFGMSMVWFGPAILCGAYPCLALKRILLQRDMGRNVYCL